MRKFQRRHTTWRNISLSTELGALAVQIWKLIRPLIVATGCLGAATAVAAPVDVATQSAAPVHNTNCGSSGVVLQVLGSGGPELQDKRASTSYLIWRDGFARVLVDSGGGAALRFGESGATMSDLDVILLTHLHVDHTADLAALVKSSFFEERRRPLPLFGP